MRKAAQLNPVSPRKKAGGGKTRNAWYPRTLIASNGLASGARS